MGYEKPQITEVGTVSDLTLGRPRPGGGGRPDRRGRGSGPLQTAVDLGPFEQLPVVDQTLELLGRDERVVHAVDLTGPRRTCRDRHAEMQVGNPVAQTAHHCGLPDSGRAGQDYDRSLVRPTPSLQLGTD